MGERLRIITVAHVPVELGDAWLRHLRHFDNAHRTCCFEIAARGPDVGPTDVLELLHPDPDLHMHDFLLRGESPGRTK